MGRKSKKTLLLEECASYFTPSVIEQMKDLSYEEISERLEKEKLTSLSPYDYFQGVKDSIKTMNSEDLSKMYTVAESLMEKYKLFGQEKALKRLAFHIKTLLKEYDIINLGVDRFVYKNDITNYIDNVSKKPVKIIEMKNYPREIPDEMIDVVQKTKGLFDEFYVLFTDYSGELEKEVEKERDPILFGGFCTKSRDIVADRFYYLGDWIDEYCDLTLDKLVSETSKDIVKTISIPSNRDELITQLNSYEEKDDRYYVGTQKKEHFFKRVVNAIKGK